MRYSKPMGIPYLHGDNKIKALRARALLVDMEEGVINEFLRQNLSELFNEQQILTDVSGSGNNWGCGYQLYGEKYHQILHDKIRMLVEDCESLQSFFMVHSLGGGTGSGLGSYILQMLADEFDGPFRFDVSVFPSSDDDVITSPYNCCLSLSKLHELSSCIFPVANDALLNVIQKSTKKGSYQTTTTKEMKPFDHMNDLVAQLLTNMTSSMRFQGSLNVDLNELTTNLVPYPSMNFILSAMSSIGKTAIAGRPRRFDQCFIDVLSPDNQLITSSPKNDLTMASAFLVRGNIPIADITTNVAKVRKLLRVLPFCQDASKIGQCKLPPMGETASLLYFYNSCGVSKLLTEIEKRASKLYARKAHFHHYKEYIDGSMMDESLQSIQTLRDDYLYFEDHQRPPPNFISNKLPPHDKSLMYFDNFLTNCQTCDDANNMWSFRPHPLI